MTSQIKIQPLQTATDSEIDFGAVVSNIDVEKLTGKFDATNCN